MNELSEARLTKEHGVNCDSRGKPGRRQVTVLNWRAWEAACADAKAGHLPWTTRRANLLVDGIDLRRKIGYDLRLGNAILTITGETRPCNRMNEAYPGLMRAMQPEWRGGVTARVVREGEIAVGCPVELSRSFVRQVARLAYHYARRTYRRSRSILSALVRPKPPNPGQDPELL